MKRALVMIITTALTLGVCTTASASPPPRSVDVRSTFTDAGFLTSVQTVSCGVAQPGGCLMSYRGHSTLTGVMSGWTDYTAWMWSNGDGTFSWYSDETFTGTIDGCGRGTFRFLVQDGTIHGSQSDPALQEFSGAWHFVSGTGTGDLATMTAGSGIDAGEAYPDTSTTGTFTGTVTCGR